MSASIPVSNAEEADEAIETFDRRGTSTEAEIQSRAEARRIKRQIEKQREAERTNVLVELPEGHEVEMLEMRGVGEQTEVVVKIREAERRGDEQRVLELLDEMVQRLADASVHNDVYGRRFWNAYSDGDLQDIYEAWALASRDEGTEGN